MDQGQMDKLRERLRAGADPEAEPGEAFWSSFTANVMNAWDGARKSERGRHALRGWMDFLRRPVPMAFAGAALAGLVFFAWGHRRRAENEPVAALVEKLPAQAPEEAQEAVQETVQDRLEEMEPSGLHDFLNGLASQVTAVAAGGADEDREFGLGVAEELGTLETSELRALAEVLSKATEI